jgi:hypothetical protein
MLLHYNPVEKIEKNPNTQKLLIEQSLQYSRQKYYQETKKKIKGKEDDQLRDKNQEKWVTLTFCGKEVKYMNELLKGTNAKVTYKTSNATDKILACRNRSETDQFSRSGIYCLMCADCGQKYLGQTGRTFLKRYNEHLQSCKYQNSNSTFAKHLHDGPLERITDTLQFIKKGKLMNSLEKC